MTGWTVVVPVKSLTAAKTRLAPELGPADRAALARAFATDTVEAARRARAVHRVVVVSDEPAIEGALRGLAGVEVVPESGPRGLAAAIAHGIAVAHGDGVDGAGSDVAVLLGDLPAMSPEHLDSALDAASAHPLAFVADAEGTGTTLATARAGIAFAPRFGADSAARHRDAGFADLVAASADAIAAGVRRDVDTADELRQAVALGVGPRTSAIVRGLGDRAPRSGGTPWHPFDPTTAPTGAAPAPFGADRKAAS